MLIKMWWSFIRHDLMSVCMTKTDKNFLLCYSAIRNGRLHTHSHLVTQLKIKSRSILKKHDCGNMTEKGGLVKVIRRKKNPVKKESPG